MNLTLGGQIHCVEALRGERNGLGANLGMHLVDCVAGVPGLPLREELRLPSRMKEDERLTTPTPRPSSKSSWTTWTRKGLDGLLL